MRIGIVCPYSWDVPGGVQFHIRDLAEYLISNGHEASVLAPADEGTELPPYVVPAGRAVPIRYNGSTARLLFGPVAAAKVLTAASGAVHFGPRHAVAAILGRGNSALDRRPEARPSGAALEFGVGVEQLVATGNAVEAARSLLDIEGAGAGALGTVLAEDLELFGRQ